jgi:zinc transporter ZupT
MLLAVIGTVIGVLVAGVLAKVFPEQDLLVLQAGLVAAGCLVGVVLDGTDSRSKRRPDE